MKTETTTSSRIVGERIGAKMAILKWPATVIIIVLSPLGEDIRYFEHLKFPMEKTGLAARISTFSSIFYSNLFTLKVKK